MKTFITLLGLDLISKYVAELLMPKSTLLYMVYNQKLAFDMDLGNFTKFLIPLMFLPLIYFSLHQAEVHRLINPKQKSLIISIGMAGIIGNYLGRFNPNGVVDFINLQYCVVNLADLYQWAAYGLSVFYVLKNKQVLKEKITSFS